MIEMLNPPRSRSAVKTRPKRIARVRGKYAHVRTSSEKFAAAKWREIVHEARKK